MYCTALVHYGSSSLLLGFCYLTMPLKKTSYHTQLVFRHLLILFQFISDTDAERHCIPSNVVRVESDSQVVMLRFPNFDFRSISIRFLAQNDDFDSIQF